MLVDYFAGIQIEKGGHKKAWLFLSIAMNIGLLAVFKYYNFFISSFSGFFDTSSLMLHVILPVGLSFHTFQAMAYTIEIYRGKVPAEKNIFIYALYVLFFPQLVAGPIERPQHLIPQFHQKKTFNTGDLTEGLRLMVWGFFKKLVIADNMSRIVDAVYKTPEQFRWYIILGTILFFSIQIYCDFSGYTDIARGAAKVMGFDLILNFNKPLFSQSIADYWRRWHISLSGWFRDYLFTPLAFACRQRKDAGLYFAVLITFLLSGLWHGAGLNFIIYGLIHGIMIITGIHFFKKRKKNGIIRKAFRIIGVNLLVSYAYIFFRSSGFNEAICIIRLSLNIGHQSANNLLTCFPATGNFAFALLIFFILFMLVFEYFIDPSLKKMNRYNFPDIVWFMLVILFIIFWGAFTKDSFIYFQF